MAGNLYVATIEAGSGKSLAVLGVMELLSSRVEKLGFFRPVIRAGDELDNDTELIRRRYLPATPYESLSGVDHETARELTGSGRSQELVKRIFARYKELERSCDFVLCEGTDFTGVSSAFELDFNAEIASQIGAPILLVANAREKEPGEAVDFLRAAHQSFRSLGCSLAAAILNRVDPGEVASITKQLEAQWLPDVPVYLVPEHEALGRPTIATIAKTLGAEVLHGEEEQLNREVLDYKIAAMQVASFLEHLEEGCLVITPGDRADVILSSLASLLAEECPHIAGLLLTGGLKPAPAVMRLVESFYAFAPPILTVDADTYATATHLGGVRAVIAPGNERKIATALGTFEAAVDRSQLARRIAVSRPTRVTPLMFEYELLERARANRRHVVLPEGSEERILRAAEILQRRQVVDLTLLGNEREVRRRISELGVDPEGLEIIDPAETILHEEFAGTYQTLRESRGVTLDAAREAMLDVNYFGTMMVHSGRADGMVSGAVHTTAETIRPAFEIIRTEPGRAIVSSVFFMCLEDRVLVYADCAVVPNPNAEELADIAISSAMTARAFGIEPRVAMLSYSTGESGRGADVERVREAAHRAKRLRPDLKIEGPIQYDAAVDLSVARTKLPESEVAGTATVFIFPDLNTGNNTYKAVQRSAGAIAIGPILQGLKKPVNDLSRGCTVTDITHTVIITAIQSQVRRSEP
jgi:phosphate acetyltransferase